MVQTIKHATLTIASDIISLQFTVFPWDFILSQVKGSVENSEYELPCQLPNDWRLDHRELGNEKKISVSGGDKG